MSGVKRDVKKKANLILRISLESVTIKKMIADDNIC